MASTEELSPTIRAAAGGELPEWAVISPERRAHVCRVAELMETWALTRGRGEAERWCAAAYLHDALRDADPDELRSLVPDAFRDLPAPLLHGPAAATLLADGGDEEIRIAIRYHTIGHPTLGELGRALYLADFLEPGRSFRTEWRAGLRERMPEQMGGVLVEVIAARMQHLLEQRQNIRPETVAFWNAAVTSKG